MVADDGLASMSADAEDTLASVVHNAELEAGMAGGTVPLTSHSDAARIENAGKALI